MGEKRDGFTIHDLEELSSFDRRTIAYYIQEGLLPKVGRRGRSTVYPQAFKERLMFIRTVRDMQDAGKLRAVTLAEIRQIMAALNMNDLVRLQQGADEAIRALFRDPDWDTQGIAVPVETVTGENSEIRSRSTKSQISEPSKHEYSKPSLAVPVRNSSIVSIKELILQIETAASNNAATSGLSERPVVQLSSVKLSAHITVTVNHLDMDKSFLLLQLIDKLRELP